MFVDSNKAFDEIIHGTLTGEIEECDEMQSQEGTYGFYTLELKVEQKS